jgi:separase
LLVRKLLEEKRLALDTLENILADSLTLLDLIGAIPSNPLYHVKISNFYYMMYNTYRQQQGKETAALKALRRSIDCVKDRSVQEKDQAQLLVKLERMAELCRSIGRVDAALGAFQEIRSSLVTDGVLKAIASTLQTRHPQVAWTMTAKADHLNRALSSIARLEMVHMDWTADFAEAEQAAALEHHFHFVLLGGENKTQGLAMDDPTIDSLLRIYIPTRFPVRRLRTLLRLLSATVGNSELLVDIRSVAADAVQLDEEALGEDAPLAPYLPHMKALFSSVTGLADGYPDLQSLDQALSVWRSIVDSNPTKEGLEGCIDGVEDLLLHLESIADLLRLKGLPHILDTVIRLSADMSRVVEGPKPEHFLHTHKLLAEHLMDAGLSDQAIKSFEAAEAFIDNCSDASGHVTAELQLALADHYLSSGDLREA